MPEYSSRDDRSVLAPLPPFWLCFAGLVGFLMMFPGTATAQGPVSADSLWATGVEYGQFLEDVERRRTMWLINDAKRTDVEAWADSINAAGGVWHLLAIAVDGCSDSANTIPYLSDLVEASEGLSMRIVPPDDAGHLMERFLTPDGRTATPTVVLLDDAFRVVGAWVERPAELQDWYLAERDALETHEYLRQKFAWYDADEGRQTTQEIARLILDLARTP